jgi:hypothetical protein
MLVPVWSDNTIATALMSLAKHVTAKACTGAVTLSAQALPTVWTQGRPVVILNILVQALNG